MVINAMNEPPTLLSHNISTRSLMIFPPRLTPSFLDCQHFDADRRKLVADGIPLRLYSDMS